ncbi:HET-domain-containing protein [Trametes coccinea BRFM310]|uniref:HET-domain-containing protein n=1 Tax=Trametes coccinea (strain BRFM310) TaxID=1353009 RepID=A0A1Y2IGY1_TRAC3|nr:HET-domain-containing protein [Trametes coccinea BRFM310]
MWLLTTDRAELKWFARPPAKYAIISHVWAKDPLPREQSFQEVQQLNFECARSGENPRSFVCEKMKRCCIIAEAHGYKLLWIDTCCINQMSSAELSEAINSMFSWYAKAAICYAFLSDLVDTEAPGSPNSSFRSSEWFRRGWTLQELIAPSDVIFLSQTWMPIASKRTVAPLLQEITGIDAGVLLGTLPLYKVSVARRLSWSSGRITTREEDEAYCLMGIFGVHLPTI